MSDRDIKYLLFISFKFQGCLLVNFEIEPCNTVKLKNLNLKAF